MNNIASITRTFAVALVLVLTATGLWATGAEEAPAAAADKQYVTDPSNRQGGDRTGVWRDTDYWPRGASRRTQTPFSYTPREAP